MGWSLHVTLPPAPPHQHILMTHLSKYKILAKQKNTILARYQFSCCHVTLWTYKIIYAMVYLRNNALARNDTWLPRIWSWSSVGGFTPIIQKWFFFSKYDYWFWLHISIMLYEGRQRELKLDDCLLTWIPYPGIHTNICKHSIVPTIYTEQTSDVGQYISFHTILTH